MADRELDPRLRAAAARSPEVAARVAGKHDDLSTRYRRLLVLLAAAAAGVGLAWGVLAFRPGGLGSRRRPSEPAEEIDRAQYLSPIKTEPAGSGEEVAPFAGFALSVDSDPPGALVSIRGVPRGEAPVLANIECRGSEKIEIRAEKAGSGAARRELDCRSDTLVKVTLQLGK